MQVILQPCGKKAKKHYYDTIENMPVQISIVEKFIDDNEYLELNNIYPNKHCMIWGIKESQKKKWDRLDSGDIVLFSGYNRVYLSARITYKTHNEKLARYLWGEDEEGGTWDWIYFLNEPKNLNIPYPNFNSIVGYDEGNIIRGFTILDSIKSEQVLTALALDDDVYLDDNIDEQLFKLAIHKEQEAHRKLSKKGSLEKTIIINTRVEQNFLRKYLFKGKLTMQCSICGKILPTEFLWCSHIKKRSLCTEEEKLDYKNVVTPMCKFGCDDLYERGYITVQNGKITVVEYTGNESVDAYLHDLDGRECKDYTDSNKKYYDEHIRYFSASNN